MTLPSVHTIVINWKLKEETVRCIESLEKQDYPIQISIVDNGSEDGSVEYLGQRFPHAELLPLPNNIGFGAACNRAILRGRDKPADYVFLLNNDATVCPSTLSELVTAAEQNPQAGILGAKVYNSNPPFKVWYAGARRRRGVLAAADIGRGQIDHGQFNQLREVDYVFGAAMLIRRKVIDQIGLFDPRFFIYLEDLDFCLRAQRAGFSLLFAPQAHVYHQGWASTAQAHGFRRYHYVKSTILFLKKHAARRHLGVITAFWGLVLLKTVLEDQLNVGWFDLRPYWNGLRSGLEEAHAVKSEGTSSRCLIRPSLENPGD